MKYMIAVDCEGVACVVGSRGSSLTPSKNYPFACKQATREANAAAQGLFEAGATQVVVWDNHGGSLNLDYDGLDERCDILLGTGFPHRWGPMDDSFDGVVFVGYHSRDNVEDAPLAHTYNSKGTQWIKINGVEVGELAIDAAVAGTLGVPPLFVASDDKAVAEAKEFFPGIETVTTKTGLSWSSALSKHPRRVEKEIFEGVQKAVKQRGQMKPFAFANPINIEWRFKRIDSADAMARGHIGWSRIDPHTVGKTVESIKDLY